MKLKFLEPAKNGGAIEFNKKHTIEEKKFFRIF